MRSLILELEQLIEDIAVSVKRIDARRPQAGNARTGAVYQPGIGPHPETQAVVLIVKEIQEVFPRRYSGVVQTNISYPNGRQKCDLCVGTPSTWEWAIENENAAVEGRQWKAQRQHADAHLVAVSGGSKCFD